MILIRLQYNSLKHGLRTLYQYPEPPAFTTPPPDAINASGIRESVRVNCSATGAPLPNITWYKNNVTIPSSYYANSDEVTGELVIDQFQPSDQATYTCIARNMYKDEVKTSTKIGTMLIQLTLSSFKSLVKLAILLLGLRLILPWTTVEEDFVCHCHLYVNNPWNEHHHRKVEWKKMSSSQFQTGSVGKICILK